jgi:hypothetical protein
MLDGSGVLGYIVREDNYGAIRWSAMPYVMAGAAFMALVWRRKGTLFPLLAAGLSWLVMAMTKDGGGSIHHAILLYPMLHWMLAASLGTIERAGRWVMIGAALLAIDNTRLVWVHRDNAQRLGGGKVWSEAIFPLADRIAELKPKVIRIPDWGMQDNLILLTRQALPVSTPAQPFDETLFTDYPEALWIGAVEERVPGIQKSLQDAAQRYGYEKAVRERICDKRGQAQFELYEYRKIRR